MTTADLPVLARDPSVLDVYDDPGQAIVLACERANAWLKAGIEVRIETIVETKAQAAAIAAFAVQKQLGKDAELAALEVQRRAERGVGLAIRRGQEAGEIAKRGDIGPSGAAPGMRGGSVKGGPTRGSDLLRPREAAPGADLVEIYAVTDGVTEDQFDEAIENAKAEGNLSRANVVRKIKGQENGRLTGEKRLDLIRDRASAGATSSQIADELGHTPRHIRDLAREGHIDIPADRLLINTASNRRIDSNRIAREAVATLDGLATTLRLINYDDLDVAEAREWATSLTDSTRPLNRFIKQIKELAQ